MEEILQYFFQVARLFAPGAEFGEGGGRRFFTESLANRDAGLLLRWTPHDGGINAGKVSIDIQGSFFPFTNAMDRKAIFLDARDMPGFSKCTRMDTTRTIVDPIADSEEIYQLVRDRKVWIAGYSSYSALSALDSKGDAVDGASTCWGSPNAAVRCLTYNKAAEQKLKGVRAVRHEIRNRKMAAEDYFLSLCSHLEAEGESEETYAEATLVRSVLAKHMTYLDTSRLAHIADKADWPTNWAKRSEQAAFMDEVLNGPVKEIKRKYRVQKRLEDSVAAAIRQYGALIELWRIWQEECIGMDPEESSSRFFAKCGMRLKDEHLDTLLDMSPDVMHKGLTEAFKARRAEAAEFVEENPDRG